VFHDQIEVKQKELQPWTAKINSKQAEIDVASSERDALAQKAAALKEARKEAQENLENLQGDQEVKVRDSFFLSLNATRPLLLACRTREAKGEQK
jgi:structural maintenance of chromosome 4